MIKFLKDNWFRLAQDIILGGVAILFFYAIFLLFTGQLPSECREDEWYSDFNTCDFAGDQY